jgi:hypothetical protein
MSFLQELFSSILMAVPNLPLLSLVEKLCEIDNEDLPQVKFTKLSGPLDDMKFAKRH